MYLLYFFAGSMSLRCHRRSIIKPGTSPQLIEFLLYSRYPTLNTKISVLTIIFFPRPIGTRVPENFKVKVVYVLDSSTFVGAENFEHEKDFTKALARMLNHNPNITQSAVITFNSFPKISIGMGSFKDIRGFSEAVDNLRYSGGGDSQLHFALTVAGISFSRDGPTVPQIIIVITNRDPTNRDSIDSLAQNLPRNGKVCSSLFVFVRFFCCSCNVLWWALFICVYHTHLPLCFALLFSRLRACSRLPIDMGKPQCLLSRTHLESLFCFCIA